MLRMKRREFLKRSSLVGAGIIAADRSWALNRLEPIEDTPSTYSSAGCPTASIALRIAAMSDFTPVAVSLCVAITTLISWFASAVRAP